MSAIRLDGSGAPTQNVPQFTKARYRTLGGLVWLRVGDKDKPVGVVTISEGSKTFVCRRTERHLLRYPKLAWAFATELLSWMEESGIAWVRVERHDLDEPAGWVAAVAWLSDAPSFEVNRPPYERQRALELDEWLFDNKTIIGRREELALFGRATSRRRST